MHTRAVRRVGATVTSLQLHHYSYITAVTSLQLHHYNYITLTPNQRWVTHTYINDDVTKVKRARPRMVVKKKPHRHSD